MNAFADPLGIELADIGHWARLYSQFRELVKRPEFRNYHVYHCDVFGAKARLRCAVAIYAVNYRKLHTSLGGN